MNPNSKPLTLTLELTLTLTMVLHHALTLFLTVTELKLNVCLRKSTQWIRVPAKRPCVCLSLDGVHIGCF